jgi:hypothetical protein
MVEPYGQDEMRGDGAQPLSEQLTWERRCSISPCSEQRYRQRGQ